jgi:Fe-S-cluster containining protein
MNMHEGSSLRGTVELRIGDRCAARQVQLPRGDVPLDAVIPFARQMTEVVIQWAERDVQQAGKQIHCRSHCGACCRQPVPVGPTEARRLARLVDSLPNARRTRVRRRFADAQQQFRETGLARQFTALAGLGSANEPPGHYIDWATRYFALGIACPFLDEESCSIHPERPLICREYLVTNAPSACAAPTRDTIERVPIAASAFRAVVAVERGMPGHHWMPLISAMDWAATHPDDGLLQPALDWVRRLQVELEQQSEAHASPNG